MYNEKNKQNTDVYEIGRSFQNLSDGIGRIQILIYRSGYTPG